MTTTQRYTVTLRRADGKGEAHEMTTRANSPASAISNAGKRHVGHGVISLIEHHPGGDTYWVQFQTNPRRTGGASLSPRYVAQVAALEV